jgi:hypothetical protein
MMKRIILYILFAISLLSGCRQQEILPSQHPVTYSSPESYKVSTIEPTPEKLPDLTRPASVTLTPSQSKSPANATIKTSCPSIEKNIPPSVASNGSVVLDSRVDDGTGRYKSDTYFLNLVGGTLIQIAKPMENLDNFATSPNQKWIAYNESLFDTKEMKYLINNLVIAASNNQPYKVVPWEDDWGAMNWLDDNHLLIRLTSQQKLNNVAATKFAFLLLDPFTNERKILKPDFPNMYDLAPIPDWGGWGDTVYNSSLKQVIYLKGSATDPISYALWDISKQKEIANFNATGDLDITPHWAPNGQHFALPINSPLPNKQWPKYELFDVTLDGQTTQLTHFSDYYPWIYIANFSWSPNGKYIALWFSYWSDKEIDFHSEATQYLAVLDISSGFVTNYCLSGEINAPIGSRRISAPLWSPDSSQIAIHSQTSENSFDVILVDLGSNQAFQIGKDLEPVGWMVSP